MPANLRGAWCLRGGGEPRQRRARGPGQGPANSWKPICSQLLSPGRGDLGSSSQKPGRHTPPGQSARKDPAEACPPLE